MSVWEIRRGIALLRMPLSFVLVHLNPTQFIAPLTRQYKQQKIPVTLTFLCILEIQLQSYWKSSDMARDIDMHITSLVASVRVKLISPKK